jgi:hypothetical protein
MGCRVSYGASSNDGATDTHEAWNPADVACDPPPYFEYFAPTTPTEGLSPVEVPPQIGIPGPEDQIEKIDQLLPFVIGADV